jgi:hypothetical protein
VKCGLNWVVGDVKLWYQSHMFNVEPAMAVCQHVEAKIVVEKI